MFLPTTIPRVTFLPTKASCKIYLQSRTRRGSSTTYIHGFDTMKKLNHVDMQEEGKGKRLELEGRLFLVFNLLNL